MADAGLQFWWDDVRGRCRAEGAGVTGKVLLDGVAFSLGGQHPLPAAMTITPGGAMAAWLQTDRFSFTGYPSDITPGG